jgi:4-amino-4-deoxy-L-arabinose transferase-like glycosyltransferase
MSADCRLRIADWRGILNPAFRILHSAIVYIAPVLLLFAGVALRIVPWLANYPLHRDEALYGYWARLIAGGQDPLLLTPWIDKPPLVIYMLAGSLKLFGVSELALRVPGMIAGILLVPVTWGLAQATLGRPTARLASALVALCPFAILFAPTAFTDPWLALWLALSAWAAASAPDAHVGRGARADEYDRNPKELRRFFRPGSFWAGLTLGLAVACKQQGVLGVPLVIGLLINSGQNANCRLREGWQGRFFAIRNLLFAALGFLLILAPLTYWDSLRWHNRPSFWDRSFTTYGGIALTPLAEWPHRATQWAEQLGYLFGLPVLSALILGLAAWTGIRASLSIAALRFRRPTGRPAGGASVKPSFDVLFCVLTAAFIGGYLLLHFVLTFQPWDRYLLPLVPFVSILAAQGGIAAVADIRTARWLRAAAAGVMILLLVYPTWLGAMGRLPVGSDHGAYAGIERVAALVRAQPPDAVVYHHSLGWYFDFYLYDVPQERRWYDTAGRLAADAAITAQAEPEHPQWLALPDWEVATADGLRMTLASYGLALGAAEPVHRPDGSRSFTLYRILRTEAADED